MTHPTLNNTPIVEAIIEIQFKDVQNKVTTETLKKFIQGLNSDYPKSSAIISTEVGITFEGDTVVNHDPKKSIDGYRLENSNYIIQCMKNRISLSKLPPYEAFVPLKDEFLKIWGVFLADFSINEISRIGVRYINKFNTPRDGLDNYIKFQDNAFNLGVDVSLESCMTRVMLRSSRFECRGIINFFINIVDREDDNSQLEVIFDTDVYRDCSGNIIHTYLSNSLDNLGKYKNELFFENINSENFE